LLVLIPVAFALTMLYGQMSTTQGASSQISPDIYREDGSILS
jgi:hypothetical protein